ncbi:Adenylate cyclase 1 protein [Magnetospirillum sp. LM-5]|uniref:adenylate/guanylate cyclase domain-containing protein n=1 Tax=Magnetospirillum sp. LM-5 TaxID=2681466 RepID=UPI00137E730D|nr:adenylate/guanylate cyclase domain-containing protein [Magnetospirillum sp. LM-5]CAA7619299.1 Adenylate cyclase 1 protein [Magnetospirillum sp. LM-5]
MEKSRVRLRIGIAVTFLIVVVPLTVAMVGFLYRQNAMLARQMAVQAMQLAEREVKITVTALFGNLAAAVQMSAAAGQAAQDGLHRPESLRPLFEQLQRIPQAYSLYYGLHGDGAFHQIVRLSPEMTKFGPAGAKPPADAKWVMRVIDSSSGERRDTYLYLSTWGKVIKIERANATYDPRERPWYVAAMPDDQVVSSGAYVFSGTGRPGLTLSKRLTTEDGTRVGVFGADLSIDSLSAFLRERSVGLGGTTFILDEDLRLIGYPYADRIAMQRNGRLTLVHGSEVDDPVVSAAVEAYRGGTQNFTVQSKEDGSTWLASLSPFPDQFGRKWVIGVVAPEDVFVGPLRQASMAILGIGTAFVLIATTAIVWLSRLLVRPIHALIEETDRIRRLELDTPVSTRSPILEIDALANAVDTMKAGLSSFGRYVPKGLVEDIVRSGIGTTIGGQRRPLTVMFSDLQGFTAATESMDPEAVLPWLSDYFDRMSTAIHANRGTIDKYIGDAVMAMWNAPLDDPDHVVNACRAMLACRDGIHKDQAGPALVTRMGLHTGIAMVGNVGSSDRMQYTALGAMVNLASRIESLNKQLGTELLVTDAVAQAVAGRFLLRPFGPVVVAGASIPMAVHELVDEAGADHPHLAAWNRAFAAYESRDWAAAIDGFAAFTESHPADKAGHLLLANARHFQAEGCPADWDGALRFTSK